MADSPDDLEPASGQSGLDEELHSLLELSRELIADGDYEDAEAVLMRAIEEMPDLPFPYAALSAVKLWLDDPLGALEAAEEAFENIPGGTPGAVALAALMQLLRAAAFLQLARPREALYTAREGHRRAEAARSLVQSRDASGDVDDGMPLDALFDFTFIGDFSLEGYEEVVNFRFPASLDEMIGLLQVTMGEAQAELGHYEEAAANFNTAMIFDESVTRRAYHGLGQMFCKQGDFAKATDSYSRAGITIDALVISLVQRVASALEECGDGSLSYMGFGLDDDEDEEDFGEKAESHKLLSAALKYAEQAHGLAPHNALAVHALADVLAELRLFAEAAEHLCTSYELLADAPGAPLSQVKGAVALRAAAFLRETGDHPRALEMAEAARSASPEDEDAAKLLLTIYEDAGRFQDALRIAEELVGKDPDDRRASWAYIHLLDQTGDSSRAGAELARIEMEASERARTLLKRGRGRKPKGAAADDVAEELIHVGMHLTSSEQWQRAVTDFYLAARLVVSVVRKSRRPRAAGVGDGQFEISPITELRRLVRSVTDLPFKALGLEQLFASDEAAEAFLGLARQAAARLESDAGDESGKHELAAALFIMSALSGEMRFAMSASEILGEQIGERLNASEQIMRAVMRIREQVLGSQ